MGTVKRSPAERLLSHVTIMGGSGCWLWTAACYRNGYGAFRVDGRTRLAHKISYETFRGLVPEGCELDHTCHKRDSCLGGVSCIHRRCINPDHLEPVKHLINVQRGCAPLVSGELQRSKTHCIAGHEYTLVNTYIVPATGHRYCRECSRLSQQRCRAKDVV